MTKIRVQWTKSFRMPPDASATQVLVLPDIDGRSEQVRQADVNQTVAALIDEMQTCRRKLAGPPVRDDGAVGYADGGRVWPTLPDWQVEAAHNVPLLDVARIVGAKLRRVGQEWVGPCPANGVGDDRFAI